MYDCELFDNYYDAIVSLGNSCATAENFKINGLANISSPFDWIVSNDTSQISKQFDTMFDSFFNLENQQLAENQDEEGHFVILDKGTNFISRHDIPKGDFVYPDTFKILNSKFTHKVESFYRRISFCNKILFVRRSKEVTNKEIIDLKQSLDQSFTDKEVHLLILKDSPNENIQRIKKDTWIVYSKFNYTGINPYVAWKGDYLAWGKIFFKIKTVSYLERLEKILTEKLNNRSVVIWGMQGDFHEIESVLQKNELEYYAYDKKLSITCENDHIFTEPIFLLDRKKFFVIVNTGNYYSEIFEDLLEYKFEMGTDCFFY
ncbi:DUF1796 family putative cysteine peptidase [Paenibacillus jilunlii]|uniref:Putative papain-like cysteine peptidase n=1 Tax=Paenibacillus jilunlii TaxID=682956 RepID=A0A1G9WF83_9BACL|nr:DUF1796 family putative cysteine peptidase [Paenibacillus jilunlii]KWX73509.1 hypothetical protein AML91_17660 [Paenibacillus jilunlii]SDM83150.1 Putative papain-like cysteine peptidase [Paenibacillus jilunlii]